jgi:hypothetical protein
MFCGSGDGHAEATPTPPATAARPGPRWSPAGIAPADGLAFFRPVLSGVLYRAGFKGGDKGRTGLTGAQRTELCEAGFSSARYIDFGKNTDFGTTQCGKGR